MIFGRVLDNIARREHGRLLAGLIRACGDFDLAEEALQDAYLKAHDCWPREGLPGRPAAWLATVARHRLLDLLRAHDRSRNDGDAALESLPDERAARRDDALDSGIDDDLLRLLFTCCHPAIAPANAMALALRTLCGLGTREIARAFVEPEATTAQRLVRVKRKIADNAIPFRIPAEDELPERLTSVLAVLYLMFNEGYTATETHSLMRHELATEAIRLARLVATLLPREAECGGLLALMLLTHARRDARVDNRQRLVPLDEQDRTRWHRDDIAEGLAILDHAMMRKQPGPYQIQAAIAALHDQAERPETTDWPQIALLYGALLRHTPTPVVELNAAVAIAMAGDPAAGLARIDALVARGELARYHLLHAARADLLRRLGHTSKARDAYATAIALTQNGAEQAYLAARRDALPP